jgi:hypothetical protein
MSPPLLPINDNLPYTPGIRELIRVSNWYFIYNKYLWRGFYFQISWYFNCMNLFLLIISEISVML